jgi:hypothetical protein
MWSLASLSCCILKLGMEVRIRFVGFHRKGSSLKYKSYYQVLSTPIRSNFPWKSIWTVKAPMRAAFFVWTATLGKILTLDSLRKRNIIVLQ